MFRTNLHLSDPAFSYREEVIEIMKLLTIGKHAVFIVAALCDDKSGRIGFAPRSLVRMLLRRAIAGRET
jgi:hypothetical protein